MIDRLHKSDTMAETIEEIVTKEQTKAYEGIVERTGEKPRMKVHIEHE